jgi:predicted membrane protein
MDKDFKTEKVKSKNMDLYMFGIGSLVLFFLSLITPALIYAMVGVTVVMALYNMAGVNKLKVEEEKDAELDKEPEEPEEPSDIDKMREDYKKAIEYLKEGVSIEEIQEGLSKKYDKAKVDWMIQHLEKVGGNKNG